jgi:hypothetical protein
MNEALDKVLFQFTGKRRMDDVSLAELQNVTEAHPYFPIGHLLLSKKLKAVNNDAFETQVQQTAAYFSNTLWLDYLLQTETPSLKLPANNSDETKPLLDKVIREEQQTQLATPEKPVEEAVYDEPQTMAAAAEEDHVTSSITGEQMQQPSGEHLTGEVVPAQPEIMVAIAEDEQYDASTTEEVMQQAADEEKQKEGIASVLEDQLAEFKKPVTADTDLKIETEPYYTVDYFASLGIKIDLSQPQDKLGTQVRKFTDWLKQMKSVKPVSDELASDPEVDNMIQGIAKTSNETKEIVTETMAQVLVKQGKTDKAIQLYIKLSFLNPDKSAYFAAKIEQLKGI